MLKKAIKSIKWYYKFAFALWDVEFRVRLKRHNHIVKAGLMTIPISIITYSVIHFNNTPPHQFSDSDCFGCHFTIPQEGDPRPYSFVDSIDNLCRKCHVKMDIVSHAGNIAPAIIIPAGLPLDASGRITCATCHDPHMDPVNPNTGGKSYFLRGLVTGKAECGLCHTSELSTSGSVTHRPAMDRAHGFSSYTVIDPTVTLDKLSTMCLDCHDNISHPAMTYPGAGVWRHGSDIGLSHPIGVNYADAAAKRRDLRPVSELDQRIIFFDGRLGCGTCHDPYLPGGGVCLRIGAKGSFQALCMTCHIR